jgi:hypothetical protein
MTIKEVREFLESKNYIDIDTYQYTGKRKSLHTDFIESVELDESTDYPTLDYQLLDMEEYDHSILANGAITHNDFGWDDNDKIVIVTIDCDDEVYNEL